MRTIGLAALLAGSAFAASIGAGDSARPPLVDAARNSDNAAIRALLQKKADVNAAEPDGSTALLWASYRDNVQGADLLIRAGAKVNAANDLGVTALWPASENGSAAMVRRLLDAGANPNLALLSGETPLMVASRSGHADVVELLLAKGANPNAHGTRGQTALMWAASQSHPDVVKVLIAHHADLNLKSDVYNEVMAVPPHGYLPYNITVPHGAETALMFAARVGDLASAKLLVDAGANVNDADAWGVSATTLAEHSGFSELAEFLLDKGADPNKSNGFTALDEAIMRRDEKLVASLLDHHADPNAPLTQFTPTRRSSDDFHFEPSLIGATPFWLAARLTEPNVMKMLLAHGADPKFVLTSKWVAEVGFAGQEKTEVSTPLLAATGFGGGNVDAWVQPPRAEREALTLEAVKILVEGGADVNTPANDGRTPLDGAKFLRFDSVVDYLTAHGAKAGAGVRGRGRGGFGGGGGGGGRGGRGGEAPAPLTPLVPPTPNN